MVVTRRRALAVLALGTARVLLGRRPEFAHPLPAAAQRLARLGARLMADDPAIARALIAEAERELAGCPDGDVARLALRTRARFLNPARVAQDLARGDVVVVDGWQLARCEMCACAYLHALATGAWRARG